MAWNPFLRLERVEQKLEGIQESIRSIDTTLIKQHASLEEHIRRTALNERSIERIHTEVRPIQAHVDRVDGALKLLGLTGLLITLVFTALRLWDLL